MVTATEHRTLGCCGGFAEEHTEWCQLQAAIKDHNGPRYVNPAGDRWRDRAVACIDCRDPDVWALDRRCDRCALVPPGHPWHGVNYNDCTKAEAHDDADDQPCWEHALDQLVEIHGGLTYSAFCAPEIGICHVPQPGESDNVWWLGFDCAHYMDLAPRLDAMYREAGLALLNDTAVTLSTIYRNLDYVRQQCAGLAAQIHAVSVSQPEGATSP
jgi:hypothetical protein